MCFAVGNFFSDVIFKSCMHKLANLFEEVIWFTSYHYYLAGDNSSDIFCQNHGAYCIIIH